MPRHGRLSAAYCLKRGSRSDAKTRRFERAAAQSARSAQRPRNRCRTMFLHRALRQQGSESLASIRPAPSARSAAVAESEGFEPPEDLHPQRFSRPPQSTTLPTLQWCSSPRSFRCAPLARRLAKKSLLLRQGRVNRRRLHQLDDLRRDLRIRLEVVDRRK